MGSANDFVKITSRPGVDPWRLFTGDDLCYPVEMFVHIMEYKSGLEGSDDVKMALDVLNHIPDLKEGGKASGSGGNNNGPAAAWKQKILSRYSFPAAPTAPEQPPQPDAAATAAAGETTGPQAAIKWSQIKPDLMEEFGCKTGYSLKEKLHLLQSVGKGPYEDSQAYLIRIRCIVCLLTENAVHSELDKLPPCSTVWVRVLFLFGLDEMEQNLVIEESDLKTLDELCKVLAMPEVKMIRRAEDMMNKEDGPPPRKRLKLKRRGKKRRKKRKLYAEDDDVKYEGGYGLDDLIPEGDEREEEEEEEEVEEEEEEDQPGLEESASSAAAAASSADAAVVKEERQDDGYDDDDDGGGGDLDDGEYKPDMFPEVQMGDDDDDDGVDPDDKPLKRSSLRRVSRKHWRCVFCDCSSFKTRSELWAHQDEKHDGYKGKCEACDVAFLKVSDLTAHNNQVHPQEAKSRKYKKYVSEQMQAQLKEASAEESAEKPFKIQGTIIIKGAKGKAVAYVCGICNHQLFSQLDMAKHTREVHNGRRYKCHLCEFKSKGRDEMGAHLLSIHDFEAAEVKVFRCTYPECRFKAISNCKVKDHIDALHLRLLQFSCEICGKQFRYKGALQSHQKDHHPDDAKKLKLPLKQKYHCQECDQVFTAPCYLKLHREKKHRNGRPPDHLCPRCGRAFKLEIYLKRHLKEFHDRDGDRPCPYCPPSDKKPTKLYSRASLYQHIQGIHNRNLVCGLCHLAFSSLSLMIVHYRLTHLKYKQYRCKECNIKFCRTSNIRDHIMRKHFDGDFQPTFEFFRDNPIVEDYRISDPANYPTKEHILAQMSLDSEKGHKFALGGPQPVPVAPSAEKYSIPLGEKFHHEEKYPFPDKFPHAAKFSLPLHHHHNHHHHDHHPGHEEKYVPSPGSLEEKYAPTPESGEK